MYVFICINVLYNLYALVYLSAGSFFEVLIYICSIYVLTASPKIASLWHTTPHHLSLFPTLAPLSMGQVVTQCHFVRQNRTLTSRPSYSTPAPSRNTRRRLQMCVHVYMCMCVVEGVLRWEWQHMCGLYHKSSVTFVYVDMYTVIGVFSYYSVLCFIHSLLLCSFIHSLPLCSWVVWYSGVFTTTVIECSWVAWCSGDEHCCIFSLQSELAAFVHCANNYRLSGQPLHELCDHNYKVGIQRYQPVENCVLFVMFTLWEFAHQ